MQLGDIVINFKKGIRDQKVDYFYPDLFNPCSFFKLLYRLVFLVVPTLWATILIVSVVSIYCTHTVATGLYDIVFIILETNTLYYILL